MNSSPSAAFAASIALMEKLPQVSQTTFGPEPSLGEWSRSDIGVSR
jgi:hypothetical protein